MSESEVEKEAYLSGGEECSEGAPQSDRMTPYEIHQLKIQPMLVGFKKIQERNLRIEKEELKYLRLSNYIHAEILKITQLPLDSEEKAKLIEISDAKWKKASEEYAAKRREIIGGYKTSELSILDGQLPNTLGRRPKLSLELNLLFEESEAMGTEIKELTRESFVYIREFARLCIKEGEKKRAASIVPSSNRNPGGTAPLPSDSMTPIVVLDHTQLD